MMFLLYEEYADSGSLLKAKENYCDWMSVFICQRISSEKVQLSVTSQMDKPKSKTSDEGLAKIRAVGYTEWLKCVLEKHGRSFDYKKSFQDFLKSKFPYLCFGFDRLSKHCLRNPSVLNYKLSVPTARQKSFSGHDDSYCLYCSLV